MCYRYLHFDELEWATMVSQVVQLGVLATMLVDDPKCHSFTVGRRNYASFRGGVEA